MSSSVLRSILARHPDILQIARLSWHEIKMVWANMWRYTPRGRHVLAQVRRQAGLKVNVGSGPLPRAEWVNIDAGPGSGIRVDMRRGLPLRDGSAELVFCEHVLDHFQYPAVALKFLRECHRVLGFGGRLRLVVHDGALIMRAYVAGDKEFFRLALEGSRGPMEAVNFLFRFNGFHQFIYDFETLAELLRRAGFATVIQSTFRGGDVGALNLDHDGADRAIQSLYVDAVKG